MYRWADDKLMLAVLSDIPVLDIPTILPEILASYNMKHVHVYRLMPDKTNVVRYA